MEATWSVVDETIDHTRQAMGVIEAFAQFAFHENVMGGEEYAGLIKRVRREGEMGVIRE